MSLYIFVNLYPSNGRHVSVCIYMFSEGCLYVDWTLWYVVILHLHVQLGHRCIYKHTYNNLKILFFTFSLVSIKAKFSFRLKNAIIIIKLYIFNLKQNNHNKSKSKTFKNIQFLLWTLSSVQQLYLLSVFKNLFCFCDL